MNLQGEKIYLRALEPSDVELLYQWENDPEVWAISNTLQPFSKYTLQQFVASSVTDIYEAKQLRLMINEMTEKQTIGIIDIFDFDPYHQRAGIGILITPPYRRMGYATESIAIIKDYLFNTLQLHQIYCNILISNKTSIRLFKKAGFKVCGLKKEWIFSNKGFEDELLLQCLKSS